MIKLLCVFRHYRNVCNGLHWTDIKKLLSYINAGFLVLIEDNTLAAKSHLGSI